MHHAVALVSSLISLGLVCAIYYCTAFPRPESWLRGETLFSILLSLLTGAFVLAVASTLDGLWTVFADGLSPRGIVSAGIDLASLAALVVAVIVFGASIRAARRAAKEMTNGTPRTPRPAMTSSLSYTLKQAA